MCLALALLALLVVWSAVLCLAGSLKVLDCLETNGTDHSFQAHADTSLFRAAVHLAEPKQKPQLPPAPAINPNRPRYSGNLSLGAHRQPRIAKGPDGTRGFELPRPHAALPPLPGLEKKGEPEEGEEGQEAVTQEPAAQVPAGEQAPGLPATAPIPVPGADRKGSARRRLPAAAWALRRAAA
jgi:hypothetical protein